MAIQFACSCGRKLQAADEHAGRRVKCPACGAESTVPGDEAAVQPAEAVPSRPGPVQAEEPPPPKTDDERPRRRREDDDEDDEGRPRRRRSRDRDDDDEDRRRPAKKARTSPVLIIVLIVGGVLLVPGCLIALLVPAVQKVREAASRQQSSNNLKQLSLAMINDADSNRGQMPAQAICDKNGKPLLSWRVAILPYIEQQQLYSQFHLDEPWDSPHNIRLVTLMPKTYAHPGDPTSNGQGLTHYRVFTGPNTPFPDVQPPFPPGRSPVFFPAGFPDGTANTILIVEAADAVTWTKPDELPYDPNKPLPKLGLEPGRPYNAALADAEVRVISPSISDRTLRAAITPAGNDILGPDW
jgi:hypothetical protein